jgi:spore coat polysaccharide biosynthesis protein SpsF (cytidylyltransferase family)
MNTVRVTFVSGPNRIATIKAIRTVLGVGLKEGKDATDVGYIDVAESLVDQLVRELKPYCQSVSCPRGERERAIARLQIAWDKLETRIVVRVSNLLADWLEKA